MNVLVEFETEEVLGYGRADFSLYKNQTELTDIYISTSHADKIHGFKQNEIPITLRLLLTVGLIAEIKGKVTSYDCEGINVKLDKLFLLKEGL